jgi:hypothetical protein
MSTGAIVLIIVAVVLVVAALAFVVRKQQKSKQLKEQFGPEYKRVVQETGGDTTRAEAKLDGIRKRVERFNIRPLQSAERTRFTDTWRAVQSRFVDDPKAAVVEADGLLGQVMVARGYPVSTFEQCAEDLSVDHPTVVSQYRAGHALFVRHAEGRASTEDLRQAMIHYRALFDELVGEPKKAMRHAAGK